ncbi:hypothetical protein ACFLU6_01770, partial [Acidobacteriota bacterium]
SFFMMVSYSPFEDGNILVFNIFRRLTKIHAGELEERLKQVRNAEKGLANRPVMEIEALERAIGEKDAKLRSLEQEMSTLRSTLRTRQLQFDTNESEIVWLHRDMETIVEKKAMKKAQKTQRGLESKRLSLGTALAETEEKLVSGQDKIADLLKEREELESKMKKRQKEFPAYGLEKEAIGRQLAQLRHKKGEYETIIKKLKSTSELKECLHRGTLVIGPSQKGITYSAPAMHFAGAPDIRHGDKVNIYIANLPDTDEGEYFVTIDDISKVDPVEYIFRPEKMTDLAGEEDRDLAPRYRLVRLPIPFPVRGGQRYKYTIRDRTKPEGKLRGITQHTPVAESAFITKRVYKMALSYGMAASSLKRKSFFAGQNTEGESVIVEKEDPVLIPVLSVTFFPKGKVMSGKRGLADRLIPAPMVGFSLSEFDEHFLFGGLWEPLQGFNVILGGHVLRDKEIQEPELASEVGLDPLINDKFRLGFFFGVTFHAGVLGTRTLSIL